MDSSAVPSQRPGGQPVLASTSPSHCHGSLDGTGAGDHDRPYRFGRRPRSSAPFPFSTRQYVRLLVLRSRLEAGLLGADDRAADLGAADRATDIGAADRAAQEDA